MTGSGSFWRACCRFKGRCGPCRDHGRVRDGSSTGSTSAPRRAGANTYSSRARRGHCPRRGFACQIPVKEDQEATRRRRGGEGGREYSAGPASCTKRTVVERAFASYQAMEGTGHPPRTNPPSSTQRASSSAQSSPGALMRRALAAVSSRCSPDGDRRGRRAVLLEWTGGGRQGRSGVPHSGVVVWRSALLLGMDAVAVQSDSGACVRGCGGCVWFVGGAPGCFVCCAAGSSRRCVTAPLSARPRRVVLCRTA